MKGRNIQAQESQQRNYKMDGEADEMSYEYRPADAYLLKEMEYKKSLLIEEFKGADVNRDNKLSEQELLAFLDKKVILKF